MAFPEWIRQIAHPGEHHQKTVFCFLFSQDAEKTDLIGFEPSSNCK